MELVDLRLPILIITVTVNIILAASVYRNNKKSATSIIFGALAIVTSLWLTDVYLSVTENYHSNALTWVRLSVFFASPQIFLFFLLAHTIPKDHIQLSRTKLAGLTALTLLMMTNALSPFTFTGTTVIDGSVEAETGPGIALFGLYAISVSISAILVLYRKLKHSSGFEREQFKYVFGGIIAMLGLLVFTVLLPVSLLKNSTFVPLVPLYTIIFLGATTYAIVKKRLFNIRAVVAKSMAYILLLVSLTSIYALLAFQFGNIFFDTSRISQSQKLLNVFLAVVLAFTLQPLKRFFEKVTDRIFYQDKYDPQVLLNDVSRTLASEIEMDKLTAKVNQFVKAHMRLSMVDIVVLEGDKIFFGGSQINDTHNKQAQILSLGKSPVFIDELLENPLKSTMDKLEIRASIPLKTRDSFTGYLMLGEKLNGEIYSKDDEQVLRILADELAVAISNAKAYLEIQQFNVTLQQKVEEATAELRKANEKLKALDETKDEFISMASHQLRTPLTTVKGYLSMVLDGDAGKVSNNQHKLLDQSFLSAQRMVYLIADLLNVSRLRTGKFVIDAHPSNLADLVEGEIAQLTETAKSRNLTLKYDKPKNFPMLMLDDTKIRQVVMNFADNAIYYTPAGGHININLADKGDSVEFTVVDDGIGVPKNEQHHMFSKFYRAGNAKKARPDGTGLGLFMAQKVIVAQGGAIIFHSEEGKGSTFGFTFSKDKLKVSEKTAAKASGEKSEPGLL